MTDGMLTPTTLAPGNILAGRYTIQATLGVGGMGSVYRAYDAQLQRQVALKLLNESKRLSKEAAAMAQLTHPSICKIHSIDIEEGDRRFLVLEFVEGKTLRAIVEESGPINPQQAINLALQILDALDHAHSQNVIHRDLKPQNLMIDESGNLKILDFGIAKLIGTGGQRVTQTGEIIGTPEYISPEQCTGGDITSSTDIYALGCCLHFMLTGKPPFAGESVIEMFMKQVHEIPTLSEIQDARLAQIVGKAMAKDAAQRFRSAAEMAEALQTKDQLSTAALQQHLKEHTQIQIPPWMVPAAIATVFAGAALGAAIYLGLQAFFPPIGSQPQTYESAFRELKDISHRVMERKLTDFDISELKRMQPILRDPKVPLPTQIEYENDCITAFLLTRDLPSYYEHVAALQMIKVNPRAHDHFDHSVFSTLLGVLSSQNRVLEGMQVMDEQSVAARGHCDMPVNRMIQYDILAFAQRHRLLPLYLKTAKNLASGTPEYITREDFAMLTICRDLATKKETEPLSATGDWSAAGNYLEAPHSRNYPAFRAHAYNTWGEALRLDGHPASAHNRYQHALDEVLAARAKPRAHPFTDFEEAWLTIDAAEAREGLKATTPPSI